MSGQASGPDVSVDRGKRKAELTGGLAKWDQVAPIWHGGSIGLDPVPGVRG